MVLFDPNSQLHHIGFLRLLRWSFTGVALVSCLGLGAVDVLYNIKNVNPKQRNTLSMLTIENVHDTALLAHVAGTYVISKFVSTLLAISLGLQ
jgi:hypothetical protein